MADDDRDPRWWEAPWKLFVETLVGTIIFLLIAAAALALNYLVKFLEGLGTDNLIIWGLKGAEYALFFVDLVLFFRFLYKTALRIWKKL